MYIFSRIIADICVHPKHTSIMYDDVPLCRVTACSHRGLTTNKSHRFNSVFRSVRFVLVFWKKCVCVVWFQKQICHSGRIVRMTSFMFQIRVVVLYCCDNIDRGIYLYKSKKVVFFKFIQWFWWCCLFREKNGAIFVKFLVESKNFPILRHGQIKT